jgi:hypothetical protein
MVASIVNPIRVRMEIDERTISESCVHKREILLALMPRHRMISLIMTRQIDEVNHDNVRVDLNYLSIVIPVERRPLVIVVEIDNKSDTSSKDEENNRYAREGIYSIHLLSP